MPKSERGKRRFHLVSSYDGLIDEAVDELSIVSNHVGDSELGAIIETIDKFWIPAELWGFKAEAVINTTSHRSPRERLKNALALLKGAVDSALAYEKDWGYKDQFLEARDPITEAIESLESVDFPSALV